MRRTALVFTLCSLLAACAPQTAGTPSGAVRLNSPVSREALAGVWQDARGRHFCLDADGVLGLPGQTGRSGLNWSLLGDVLILRTLDSPGGQPLEERFGLTRVEASRLELRAPGGAPLVWHKSRDAVGRLNGTVTYRERMALPPSVVVAARLYPRGSELPIASALSVESGQGALPFRLHYLARDMAGAEEALLGAALFYGSESLFATPSPVPVRLDQSPELLLQRTLPGEGEPAPVAVPAQFHGTAEGAGGTLSVTLYLEPGDLYLLHTRNASSAGEGRVSVGRWRQIDRNQTIQLARGTARPLSAALRPEGSLLLTTPDASRGEVELRPTVQALPEQPFRVLGMFRLKDGRAVLTECASGLDCVVRPESADFSALRAAYEAGEGRVGDALPVECEVTVRHRGLVPRIGSGGTAGAGDELPALDVVRFVDVRPGTLCAAPYASSPLTGTYWRLMTLNGQPARAFPNQAEPHLILRDDGQAAGSDGCNNFFMQWTASGSSLSFQPGGTTLMLCPQGAEQAAAFKNALAGVDAWAIHGSVLELSQDGRPLASFEAVAL
ncbi:MAG: META domain-containing protein [Desulfovibrionaceae bacterium]|nr:META domain-containing protein [Desulfovibrionaceae bacterium]